MIPRFIYRGDADPYKTRRLKEVWPGGIYSGILTNLSNGGNGLEIFNSPLVETINRHIVDGWQLTHYLSFSSSRDIALSFAAGPSKLELYPATDKKWDAALITLDTQKVTSTEELEKGVFKCQFMKINPIESSWLTLLERVSRIVSNKDQAGTLSTIMLIDATTYLKSIGTRSRAKAIANAEKDAEWLVLPLDRPDELSSELTSVLYDGCISKFEPLLFKYPRGN